MNKTSSLSQRKNPFVQKNDFLLLAVFLVLALVLFLLLSLFSGGKGNTVDITVDGKPYRSLPLTEDCEFFVPGISGDNQVCIRNGSVSVTAADCPDLICVHHMPICNAGERIVCLPHRVVISISKTAESTSAPDAVSQ